MDVGRPSSEAASAANAILRALLTDDTRFLDSALVGQALSGDYNVANPKMVATQARKAGEIIGVWDGAAYRYPRFQFDAAGKPREHLKRLIEILPGDTDGTHRDAALWLFAPDGALDERSPAEVFPVDPDRVIAVCARRLRIDSADE